MTSWRPPQAIKVKVIGIVIQHGRFLAAEVPLDDGSIKGIRPLGGSIDFGETREEALAREFHEELGTSIDIFGGWQMFENIYRHEGYVGHEIVFAAQVRLADATLYEHESIDFTEDDGMLCRARWFDLPSVKKADIDVFPVGLIDWLSLHPALNP